MPLRMIAVVRRLLTLAANLAKRPLNVSSFLLMDCTERLILAFLRKWPGVDRQAMLRSG